MNELTRNMDFRIITNPKDAHPSTSRRSGTPEITPYLRLRWSVRDQLSHVGIRSNPGWTDQDIVDSVRAKIGLPPSEPFNNSFELYRDHLIITLQEAGVELREPITEVDHINEGLETLLSR